ncbi:MAG: putative molybdenum carrier protein [Dissulfuribacterales bacterium]
MADIDENDSIPGKDITISHGTCRITKIISGGQTGADQAALDVAIEKGIPYGGWVPKGRLTEAGMLLEKYQLKEMETASYPLRTEQNVIDSDGTLIVSHGELTGGSAYTREMAEKHGKPWIHIDADETPMKEAINLIWSWIDENQVEVLNVAGARASKDTKIYPRARAILEALL